MDIMVREYLHEDLPAMMEIWNAVIEKGNAFPQKFILDDSEAKAFFASQSRSMVAEVDGQVVGLYILHPNGIGRCSHLANASYAVKEGYRGKHVGEALVQDSLKTALTLGFTIMQFNAVVATNTWALHLYDKLGFTRVGTIPDGFRSKYGFYEDIVLFYKELVGEPWRGWGYDDLF
ncbi:MAG: GNAT family N-acetyltransferase [Clostridiales bacterium]|nr:GNAT family N-acetyltransferase [Clostridiales bacterium]